MDAPPAIRWFKIYVAAICAMYMLIVIAGVIIFALNIGDGEGSLAGILVAAIGIPFLILYGVGLFLPHKPWAWIYALVLIAGGFTSCLTMPFSIALLIQYVKPELKMYYGWPA